MDSYQVLIQISWYAFYFIIGAIIEYFNLRYDQILSKMFENLVITMRKPDHILILLLMTLLPMIIFFNSYLTIYKDTVNLALTALLFFANYMLVFETRKMRNIQIQPNVFVSIAAVDEYSTIIEFFVQNVGLGPAYDIKFGNPPDFQYSTEKSSEGNTKKLLSEAHYIKNGIKFLAPNQKIQLLLMDFGDVIKLNSSDPLVIEISYADSEGENHKIGYKIDFGVVNTQIEIAKHLMKDTLLEFYDNWKRAHYTLNTMIPTSAIEMQYNYLISVATKVNKFLPEKLISDLLIQAEELKKLTCGIWLHENRLRLYENTANVILSMYNNFDKYFED